MDWWQIITVIVVPTASAIWVWYTTKYVPARQAREAAEAKARQDAEADTREYHQVIETDAFRQVLKINETLIEAWISVVAKSIAELHTNIDALQSLIETKFNPIPKIISDARTQIEFSNRDRVRMEEIVADIDMELHEIKAGLRALSENDGRRQNQTE